MQNSPTYRNLDWDEIITLLEEERLTQDTLNEFKDRMAYCIYEVMEEQLYSDTNNYVLNYQIKESDWSSVAYEFYWHERKRLSLGKLTTNMNPYFYYRKKAKDLKTMCRNYLDSCGLERNKRVSQIYHEVSIDESEMDEPGARTSPDVISNKANKPASQEDLILVMKEFCEKEIHNSHLSPGRKRILEFCILERNSPLELFSKNKRGYDTCRKMVWYFKLELLDKLDKELANSIENDQSRDSLIRWYLMLRKSPHKQL